MGDLVGCLGRAASGGRAVGGFLGKMYDRHPFDRPETIHRLGEKLFTRIKDQTNGRYGAERLPQGWGVVVL